MGNTDSKKISPYQITEPLPSGLQNSCLSNECSYNIQTSQEYCTRKTCFYNSTLYSLLNGYRIKKIIYDYLQTYYHNLSDELKTEFTKSISKEDIQNEFKSIRNKFTFLMYKLIYFMCESNIDGLFDASISETDVESYKRTLLKILLDSDLTKKFLVDSLKYSVETSWTILMFILKKLNYTDYEKHPFSILTIPFEQQTPSIRPPKMLILADPNMNLKDVGCVGKASCLPIGSTLKKLPLTDTRTLPSKFYYQKRLYSLECGVTFQIQRTMSEASLPLIPEKWMAIPVYGHFEGHYVCRDAQHSDLYNPISWDDLTIYDPSQTIHYTWVMYLRVDQSIDEPIDPESRYFYEIYEQKDPGRHERSYPKIRRNERFFTEHEAKQFVEDLREKNPESAFFVKKMTKRRTE